MVQETSNNPSQLKKITTWILLFISAFVVYFTVMSALAPSRKIKEMNELYGFKQDGKTAFDERILSDSAYLKQMRNKAFLQSRVTMAETDSVYLTINLTDTVVNLEISGVVVHRTHINEYSVSKILLSGNEYTLLNMMSKPFTVERLAEEISGICLEEDRVISVHVRVEKPGAVRFSESVGVEIERKKNS